MKMNDYLHNALNLCNLGFYDKTLEILEEVFKDDLNIYKAWRALVQIHLTRRKLRSEPIDELIEALRCDPLNVWTLMMMGNMILRDNHYLEYAKEYIEKDIEYSPDNVIAIDIFEPSLRDHALIENALIYLMKSLLVNDKDDAGTDA